MNREENKSGISAIGGGAKLRLLVAALAALTVLSAFLAFPREAGAQSRTLNASNIKYNSAELEVGGYTGSWWYQEFGKSDCRGPHSHSQKATVSNLQQSTYYTFTAYSASAISCSPSNSIASTSFTTLTVGLTGAAQSSRSAKLTISNYDGSKWWYKGTQSGAQCREVAAGTTSATIAETLERGTSYTYNAYNASGCASGNRLVSDTFSTSDLSAGSITGTGAKLTISQWSGAWWYQRDGAAQCTAVTAGTTSATLTGLVRGVSYTYYAYKTSACSNTPFTNQLGNVSFQTTVPTESPPKISNFSLSPGPGLTDLSLSWDSPPSGWNITGYEIRYKKSSEGTYTNFKSTGSNSTSYRLTFLEPGAEYDVGIRYYIRPDDKSNETKASPVVYGKERSRGYVPKKVEGVTVTPGLRSLAVSWNDASETEITISKYRIEWVSGLNFGACGSPRQCTFNSAVGCKEVSNRSYNHTGLTVGKEYRFRVRAKSTQNEWGTCSDVKSGIALGPAPGKVTGVSVTRGIQNLAVSWSAVSGATGYEVQWKSAGQNWDPDNRQNTVSSGTTTTSSITGLIEGTEYTVRVAATKTNALDGSPSDEVTGTPYAPTPGQVTGVSASAPSRGAAGVGKLNVSWNAILGATGFDIQYKKSSGSWSTKSISVGSATADTITGLENGTTYTVQVRATNQFAADTTGEWSDEKEAETNAGPPARVTGVSVDPGVKKLTVSWISMNDVTGYKVQWKSGNQNWSSTRENDETGTSSTIDGLRGGVEHTVRVWAHNADGDGQASQSTTAVPKHQKPAKVTGVSVTEQVQQLQVSWSTLRYATGYDVRWKSAAQSDWSQKTVSGGSSGQTIISSLTAGTPYSVQVRGTRTHADDGNWSDIANGTPDAPLPGQVTGVSVTNASGLSGGSWVAELTVRWSAVTDASGYKVQWKSGNQSWPSTSENDETGTSSTITGLTGGTEYTVRVQAKKDHITGDPPWSSPATGRPNKQPPSPVTAFTLTAGVEQLEASWTAPADAPAPENYMVQWKSDAQGYTEDPNEKRHAIVEAAETSYTISGLVGGRDYAVQVMATIEYADNSPAMEANATPLNPPPPDAEPGTQPGQQGPGGAGGGPDGSGGGGDDVSCPDYAPTETAGDVETERDPDTLAEFVREASIGVKSILGEETEESEAIDRLVSCFGVDGDWKEGSVYLFAITDERKYLLAPSGWELAGTYLNLVDDNRCDVAAELIRAAREEALECDDDLDLLPDGDATGFVQYLWDNPADPGDDNPGYEDRGEAPGNSPKLSYVERITDEDILPGRIIVLGSGYYPDWEPPGSGPQPPSSGGGESGGGCAVAGTGGTLKSGAANLLPALLALVFAALLGKRYSEAESRTQRRP